MNFLAQIIAIVLGYFVIRILIRQFFISSQSMTKIVSIFFIFQYLLFYFSFHFAARMLINCFVFVLFFLTIFVFHKYREAQFRQGFTGFLTALILQMKIGKSFRVGFQNALNTLPLYQKEILQKIYQNVAFTPQENDKNLTTDRSFKGSLFTEFYKIDRSQHKTIEKIENFRSRLIIANNFRRRSGRIRENIFVQVSIMGFFYVSSFVYVILNMNFYHVQDILIVSAGLFLFGTILAFVLGRRIKWSI